MDLNTLALTISVVALALTVPLSIAGNLLTPRIRDWYSTTTSRRLKKRIEALERELESVKDQALFSGAELEVLLNQIRQTRFLVLMFTAIFVVAAFFVEAFQKILFTVGNHVLLYIALWLCVAATAVCAKEASSALRAVEDIRRRHTIPGRSALANRIELM